MRHIYVVESMWKLIDVASGEVDVKGAIEYVAPTFEEAGKFCEIDTSNIDFTKKAIVKSGNYTIHVWPQKSEDHFSIRLYNNETGNADYCITKVSVPWL